MSAKRTPAPLHVRAVIYARISSAERQSAESIQSQVTECKAIIARHEADGWALETAVGDGGILADVGYSGDTENRPGYQTLLKALEADRRERAPFDVIVAYRSDRLWRDTEQAARMTKYAARKKVHILAGSVDTRNAAADYVVAIESTTGKTEKASIRGRTGTSLRNYAKAGRNVGGCPYGYRSVPDNPDFPRESAKHLVIREEHAKVVRRIFKAYAAGESIHRISYDLNEDGVPAPSARWYEKPRDPSKPDTRKQGRDGKWRASSVLALLDNPAYKGERTHGCYRNVLLDDDEVASRGVERRRQQERNNELPMLKVAVPVIVARDLWDKVDKRRALQRAEFKRNATFLPGGAPGRSIKILLPVVCDECGMAYTNAGSYPLRKKERVEGAPKVGPKITKLACSARISVAVKDRKGNKTGKGKVCGNDQRVRLDLLNARVLEKLKPRRPATASMPCGRPSFARASCAAPS